MLRAGFLGRMALRRFLERSGDGFVLSRSVNGLIFAVAVFVVVVVVGVPSRH